MSQAHVRWAVHKHDRYLTLLGRSIFLPPEAAGVNLSQALQTEPIRFGQQIPPPQARSRRKWSGGRLSHITSQVHVTVIRLPLCDGHLWSLALGPCLNCRHPHESKWKKAKHPTVFFVLFCFLNTQKPHFGRHTCVQHGWFIRPMYSHPKIVTCTLKIRSLLFLSFSDSQ